MHQYQIPWVLVLKVLFVLGIVDIGIDQSCDVVRIGFDVLKDCQY